jgi:1,4-dihydroxy-2-naphthoyl-CoA hydrolase
MTTPGPPVGDSMSATLGIEVVDEADGLVRGRLPVSDRVKQPYGLVHGGALLTLA